jgi:hypothetical protein
MSGDPTNGAQAIEVKHVIRSKDDRSSGAPALTRVRAPPNMLSETNPTQ